MKDKHQIETLEKIWDTSWKLLLLFLAGITFYRSEFIQLYSTDRSLFFLVLILFIITMAIILGYLTTANIELGFFRDYIDLTKTDRILADTWVTAFIIVVFCSALIYTVQNILIYSVLWLCYGIGDYFAGFLVSSKVEDVLNKQIPCEIDPLRLKALEEMEFYYVKRPHHIRRFLFSVLNVGVIALAVSFKYSGNLYFRNAAYMGIILIICIAESFILFWRIEYYGEMKKIENLGNETNSNLDVNG